MKRLRELDFLRGVAIILVLLKHSPLFWFTTNIGWIGVDLFFVLSGFLVSGLLFKEYLKFGNISPIRFLIRRGFKIYPIYFLFYIPYLIPILISDSFNLKGFLSDMTFTQNYIWGMGYAYGASWSLAVEEHFYFGFSLLLWFGLKSNKIRLKKTDNPERGIYQFESLLLLLMFLCLVARLISNLLFPDQQVRNYTMTHLRIDSLLAGVFISHLYYFRYNYLNNIFKSYKFLLVIIAFLGLAWTPFLSPVAWTPDMSRIPPLYVRTIGFSLLYLSFGIILIYFLLTSDINQKLNKIFSALLTNVVSKIGYCSYSIYIIHTFVNKSVKYIISHYNLSLNHYAIFLLTSALSIGIGMLMTYKIEKFFLRIRDRYYPGRTEFDALKF